ncbi:serine--tRNA ligase [bacterium]|nr:serine--tRNA ligase [bacterium]
MLDIKFIRENLAAVKKSAKDKNVQVDIAKLLDLDKQRRKFQTQIDGVNRVRKNLAKNISKPSAADIKAGKSAKEKLAKLEKQYSATNDEYKKILEAVPNVSSKDTPAGNDESSNKVLRKVGKPAKFKYKPKTHLELGEALDVIDMARAAKVSGARFAYLKGGLAMLEFALIQHAMATLTDEKVLTSIIKKAKLKVSAKPFIPIVPPVLIKPDVMQRMDRLEPKNERYHTATDDLYLIGSAEHSIGPIHMNEILQVGDMPVRYVGFSTSFRREAGSYGQDTKGIMRVHQFDKVEMETFSSADDGLAEHELMIAIQEHLVKSLDLPYQVVLKCTGDQGKPNNRGVDIEMWMPSQNKYRETHSADYMTDYQARRLSTKVKMVDGQTELVHTNDATAFAIGRTLIAIMENNQQEDGSIEVPKVLQSYSGLKVIKK